MWLARGKVRFWDGLEVNVCFVTGFCPKRLTLNETKMHTMYRLITRILSTCVLWRRNLYIRHRRAYKEAPQVLLLSLGNVRAGDISFSAQADVRNSPGETISKIYHWSWSLPSSKQNTSLPGQQECNMLSDRAHYDTPVLTLPRWQCKTQFLMSLYAAEYFMLTVAQRIKDLYSTPTVVLRIEGGWFGWGM